MPIFGNAARMRDMETRSGDMHLSAPWAQEFTERLQSRMRQFGEASQTKTMELEGEFKDFGLKEVGGQVREARLAEAGTESQKALAAIAQVREQKGPISSLSQLVQRRQQKRQKLEKARQSLERAQEFYKATGSQFQFQETGYYREAPEASVYENIFDEAVEQRKQEYAEMYGFDSFDSIQNQGYGMTSYSHVYAEDSFGNPYGQAQGVEYGNVGQRDILDMVMSDITGMSYSDLAKLNTINLQDRRYGHTGDQIVAIGGSGELKTYTADQMEALRDFFVTSNVGAFEAANKRAEAEDKFRREAAQTAKQQALKGAVGLEKTTGEQLGSSLEDVQLQIRELDEDFMKKVGSFKSSARRRKVKSVSFDKGRPQ